MVPLYKYSEISIWKIPLYFFFFSLSIALDLHVSNISVCVCVCEWIVIINVSSNNHQHKNESRANGHCHFVTTTIASIIQRHIQFSILKTILIYIETSAIFIGAHFSDYVICYIATELCCFRMSGAFHFFPLPNVQFAHSLNTSIIWIE